MGQTENWSPRPTLTGGDYSFTPQQVIWPSSSRGRTVNSLRDGPPQREAQAALYSYIAYYGTFRVDQTQGAVIHQRQGHLIPDRVTEGMRYFSFSGNRLMLTAPPTGGGMVTTLTWERIE